MCVFHWKLSSSYGHRGKEPGALVQRPRQAGSGGPTAEVERPYVAALPAGPGPPGRRQDLPAPPRPPAPAQGALPAACAGQAACEAWRPGDSLRAETFPGAPPSRPPPTGWPLGPRDPHAAVLLFQTRSRARSPPTPTRFLLQVRSGWRVFFNNNTSLEPRNGKEKTAELKART